MLILFVRVIILYSLVFFVLRLTGKRQIRDLQPFDLVATLLIADLASVPASNTGIPLLYGIVPILALFLMQQFISWISLKSEKIRNFVCGRALILVRKGVVQEQALKGSLYSLSDLLEQLRTKDIFDLSDVEYAILETNGELSVLLKGPKQNPTYEAMNLPSPVAMPPYMLIQDGKVHFESLQQSGHDLRWLNNQLRTGSCEGATVVFFAFLSSDGTVHIQEKQESGGGVKFVDPKAAGKGKSK